MIGSSVFPKAWNVASDSHTSNTWIRPSASMATWYSLPGGVPAPASSSRLIVSSYRAGVNELGVIPGRLGGQAAGSSRDVPGADAGRVEQFLAGPRPGQLGNCQVPHGQVGTACAGQRVDDSGAEAALGVMILGDHQPAARGCRSRGQRVRVDGLDGVHIDDACAEPVGLELVGGGEAGVQGHACPDQGDLVL